MESLPTTVLADLEENLKATQEAGMTGWAVRESRSIVRRKATPLTIDGNIWCIPGPRNTRRAEPNADRPAIAMRPEGLTIGDPANASPPRARPDAAIGTGFFMGRKGAQVDNTGPGVYDLCIRYLVSIRSQMGDNGLGRAQFYRL